MAVLDDDPKVRVMELEVLRQTPHVNVASEVLRLVEQLDKMHGRYRLP